MVLEVDCGKQKNPPNPIKEMGDFIIHDSNHHNIFQRLHMGHILLHIIPLIHSHK